MNHPFTPLSETEFKALDYFLLRDVDADETMTIEMFDGYLHAIAIAPVTVPPKRWLPKVWGTAAMMPPMESLDQLNHILGLVMRHYNSVIAGLKAEPREVDPVWLTQPYRGKEYDEAQGWAYGFIEGMTLCADAWLPMLETSEGQAWYRPSALLRAEDFHSDQEALTKTPAMRAKLAAQIPEAVLAMHAYWLPFRHAVHEPALAKAMSPKVGRNEPCPCGSGRKFKKCCGLAGSLH